MDRISLCVKEGAECYHDQLNYMCNAKPRHKEKGEVVTVIC